MMSNIIETIVKIIFQLKDSVKYYTANTNI